MSKPPSHQRGCSRLERGRQIGDLLADLAAKHDLLEVFAVDGGSEDRTRDIVRSHDGVTPSSDPRSAARRKLKPPHGRMCGQPPLEIADTSAHPIDDLRVQQQNQLFPGICEDAGELLIGNRSDMARHVVAMEDFNRNSDLFAAMTPFIALTRKTVGDGTKGTAFDRQQLLCAVDEGAESAGLCRVDEDQAVNGAMAG